MRLVIVVFRSSFKQNFAATAAATLVAVTFAYFVNVGVGKAWVLKVRTVMNMHTFFINSFFWFFIALYSLQ